MFAPPNDAGGLCVAGYLMITIPEPPLPPKVDVDAPQCPRPPPPEPVFEVALVATMLIAEPVPLPPLPAPAAPKVLYPTFDGS